MYIASTENYRGAYEAETLWDIIKKAGEALWESEAELTEVYLSLDNDNYLLEEELKLVNKQVNDIKIKIRNNVTDTEFYNQETARLIYDRI